MVIAQFTLVTLFSYDSQIAFAQLLGLTVHSLIVEALEERVERRTEREAAPAAITQVKDPTQLLIQG